jgi:hypothetical protein
VSSTNFSSAWKVALGLVFAAGIAGVTTRAQAAGEDVEAIFKKGTELRRQGRDADALVEFQKAARLQDSPRAWAQVALAEQALGLWLDANAHLGRALDKRDDTWIQKNESALEVAHRTIRTHLCQVEVWGAPSGAQVVIDGKRAGSLPTVATWLEPGSVALEITAAGFVPLAKTLNLPEGGHVREHADLRRPRVLAATPAAATTEPQVSGAAPPEDRPPVADAQVAEAASEPKSGDARGDASSPTHLRPYAWAAAAGAAAGLGVGVFGTVKALLKQNEFENHTGPNPSSPTMLIQDCATAKLSAACKTISDAHDSAVKLAVVGYAIGGALAVGSVVLFVLSSEAERPSTDSAVACLPDLLNPGVSCRLRF